MTDGEIEAAGSAANRNGSIQHWSDCAVHNEPAYPAGPCDCGGYWGFDPDKGDNRPAPLSTRADRS